MVAVDIPTVRSYFGISQLTGHVLNVNLYLQKRKQKQQIMFVLMQIVGIKNSQINIEAVLTVLIFKKGSGGLWPFKS